MYTLNDVRNQTYKLLNEYSTVTASIDTTLTDRVDDLINQCYFELSKRNRISSTVQISQFPTENMLGETFSYDTHTTTAVSYTAASAYAYSFEVNNECSVDIKESSTTLSTLTITGISVFTQYRGFITAVVSANDITLSFEGDTIYNIQNVALYPYTFGNATASIPSFKPYCEYAMPSDFDTLNRFRYRQNENYGNFTDYRIEGNKILIPREYSAEFFFDYWAYPSALTSATDTFSIRDDNVLIIQWGVAGAILLGDGFNIQAGRELMNIYREKLYGIKKSTVYGRQTLYNIKGW